MPHRAEWAGGEVGFADAAPLDADAGEKAADGEPLATLKTCRRIGSGILFGRNLIPRTLGCIAVGDAVAVLESD